MGGSLAKQGGKEKKRKYTPGGEKKDNQPRRGMPQSNRGAGGGGQGGGTIRVEVTSLGWNAMLTFREAKKRHVEGGNCYQK